MKGVMGGTCCKYTGEIEVCLGTSSGISMNGLGIYRPEVYPLKSEYVYKLISYGTFPSHPIMNITSLENSIKCTPLVGGGTTLVSRVGSESVVTIGRPKSTKH